MTVTLSPGSYTLAFQQDKPVVYSVNIHCISWIQITHFAGKLGSQAPLAAVAPLSDLSSEELIQQRMLKHLLGKGQQV